MNPIFHSASCPNLSYYQGPQAQAVQEGDIFLVQPLAMLPEEQEVPVDMNLDQQVAMAAHDQLGLLQLEPNNLPPLLLGARLVRDHHVLNFALLLGDGPEELKH